jgi:hypothetical protein
VKDDIHIPEILWISSRKEGVGELTKTGKKSKGTIKYNFDNNGVWGEALNIVNAGDMEYRCSSVIAIIEEPESRMAIFDSKTIQATIWTGRFIEKALRDLHSYFDIPIHVKTIRPSEVRLKIAGKRHADSKEVDAAVRRFLNDDKFDAIKSHARSALNLYVAAAIMEENGEACYE